MFRRNQQASATMKRPVPGQISQQQVTTVEGLLRTPMWESLSDIDRLNLLTPYHLPTQQVAAHVAPQQARAWAYANVATQWHSDAVEGIRSWLATAPADAHLYVGGAPELGYTGMALEIARQEAAKLPDAVAYLYLPDPADLTSPKLVGVPRGIGAAFARALDSAVGEITSGWADSTDRPQLIHDKLDPFLKDAPEAIGAYLTVFIQALLDAAQGDGSAYPYSGSSDDDDAVSPPIAHISPEPEGESGAPVVDGTKKGGELNDWLLRANGGVLVVTLSDIDVGNLTLVLRQRELTLRDGLPPVPLTVRVMLLGGENAYQSLMGNDEDFSQTFRYEVWCQDTIPWTNANEAAYAALAQGLTTTYGLPAYAPDGIAALIQESARRSGGLNRSRLSIDFYVFSDLIIEAAKTAAGRGSQAVQAADVDGVLAKRQSLQKATSVLLREAILFGESITPTEGRAVGQINGMGIVPVHPYEGMFAVPMRISATVKPGKDEHVLDVESESAQADASHVRGELTMEGYLSYRYGRRVPLSLFARIRFEQEHGGTGGDSASAAQLFALLSALADLPIRRSLAITGAVGQYGEIQPIGGVNIKIEGFWELCRMRRAAGEREEGYGMLIPATNVRDLMLRRTVAQSIASEGWFTIQLIGTVDEAIPLLMGVPAQTLHERVEQQLRAFAVKAGGRS